MSRSRTVAGTSYAQREALRALANACRRAGGPAPLRKLSHAHLVRIGALVDLGLVRSEDGETRTHRDLMGRVSEYVERVYEPTATGEALLERTEGELPPAPTPLRDEHRALLGALADATRPRTAGGLAAAVGDVTARQAGSRLSLLARHGFAASFEGEYMEPTHWIITDLGREAAKDR